MELQEFEECDFDMLYDFMKPIWFDTYKNIIPKEQISYLVEHYFSSEAIIEFREKGYQYFKIMDNGIKGIVVIVERENEIYLDKLYLSLNERGKGYPSFVFKTLLTKHKDITLNVNQNNERACRCYLKNGFVTKEEQTILLEDGMINKDYRMILKWSA